MSRRSPCRDGFYTLLITTLHRDRLIAENHAAFSAFLYPLEKQNPADGGLVRPPGRCRQQSEYTIETTRES